MCVCAHVYLCIFICFCVYVCVRVRERERERVRVKRESDRERGSMCVSVIMERMTADIHQGEGSIFWLINITYVSSVCV